MKRKRILSIVLTISVVLTSIGTVFAVNNEDFKPLETLSNIFNENNKDSAKELGSAQSSPKADVTPKTETVKNIGVPPNDIFKGTKKSLSKNFKDKYNFDKTDIEELLKQGYTIQQIFKADEIGNRIDEDPKGLLERKTKENMDLDTVEKEITAERIHTYLQRLKEKYPAQYEKLANQKMNEEQCVSILGFIDNNNVASIDNLISEYKKNGEAAFKNYLKAKQKSVSEAKRTEYQLTKEETAGISDEEIDKIAEMANKNNLSVKELVKGLKAQREKGVNK